MCMCVCGTDIDMSVYKCVHTLPPPHMYAQTLTYTYAYIHTRKRYARGVL